MVKVQRLFAKTNLKIPVYWEVAENEKSGFGKGCTATLRKLNCFLNIVIGSFIGVLLGTEFISSGTLKLIQIYMPCSLHRGTQSYCCMVPWWSLWWSYVLS